MLLKQITEELLQEAPKASRNGISSRANWVNTRNAEKAAQQQTQVQSQQPATRRRTKKGNSDDFAFVDSSKEREYERRVAAATSTAEKDEIFREFFEDHSIWGRITYTQLSNLGRAFTLELENLGFSEVDNPFILYVKTLLPKAGDKVTAEKYNVIHNLYVSDKIDDNDLRGRNATLALDSVIFNQNLFALDAQQIKYIVSIQQYLLVKQNIESITKQSILDRYENRLYDNRKLFIRDLLYKPGDLVNSGATGAFGGKLNDAGKIQDTLYWAREGRNDKVEKKSPWKDGISQLRITPDNVKKIMTVVAMKYAPSSEELSTMTSKYKLSAEITPNDFKTLERRLNLLDISRTNYTKVLDYIKSEYVDKNANA